MKTTKTLILILLVLTLMVFIAACKKAPAASAETTTNIATPADTAPALTPEEQELATYKEDKLKVVDAHDKIIADYRAEMTDASGKLAAKYDKKIVTLEAKNKELRNNLEKATYTDKLAWDTFKLGVDKTIETLSKDLKKYEIKETDKEKK